MALLDVLFPDTCMGCGRPGAQCCVGCRGWARLPASVAWPRPVPRGLPQPWAVAAYDGVARELLLSYKERGAVGLGPILAVALASAVQAALPDGGEPVALVPVPSSRRAVRDRGDDVVLRLTRRAAGAVRRAGGDVTVVPALRHGRRVADSAGLDAYERRANLAGAFTVSAGRRRQLDGALVVITDDLMTTGTTVAEAAQVLRTCEAVVVGAAVVAATQRRATGGQMGASGLLGDG